MDDDIKLPPLPTLTPEWDESWHAIIHPMLTKYAREAVQADRQQRGEPVGKVYRYGRNSAGSAWHGVHWFSNGIDLPDGTPLFTASKGG